MSYNLRVFVLLFLLSLILNFCKNVERIFYFYKLLSLLNLAINDVFNMKETIKSRL